MDEKKVVTDNMGKTFASEQGFQYFPTSAKSGYNINEVFYSLGAKMIEN